MGRPLRKDVNGIDAIGTPLSTALGIRIEAVTAAGTYTDATYNTTTNYAYIVKQRGAKTFVVANQAGTKAVCVLQSTTPTAAGQMRINGYVGGNGVDNLKAIAKITKRVATDFNGVRYKWYIENDSSSDYIVLTAT